MTRTLLLALVTLSVLATSAYAKPSGMLIGWGHMVVGPDLPPDVISVAAGRAHSMAVRSDGTVHAWGDNDYEQCILPSPDKDFVSVSSGQFFNAGLKRNGSVVVWGSRWAPQYGHIPEPNSGFTAISAGAYHCLALRSDGSIAAWGGYNSSAQCAVPQPNTGYVAVKAGAGCSSAIRSDGSLVIWGTSSTIRNVPLPNSGYVDVVFGLQHVVALKSDGSVRAWGDNRYGQCTVPSPNAGFIGVAATDFGSFGIRGDGSVVAWGHVSPKYRPSPNTGFVTISGGMSHCIGLRRDGSIACWGDNTYGQCGVPGGNSGFTAVTLSGGGWMALKKDGTINTPTMSVPSEPTLYDSVAWCSAITTGGVPVEVGGGIGSPEVGPAGDGYTMITQGEVFGFALHQSGILWPYGANSYHVLEMPQPNLGWEYVAAGRYHALGIRGGAAECWGLNVAGECNVPPPNRGFVALSGGEYLSVGLKSDGSVAAWGLNNYGQCDVPAPNADFTAVAANGMHCLGLKKNGSIVAWGESSYGQSDLPVPNDGFVAIGGGYRSDGYCFAIQHPRPVATPDGDHVFTVPHGQSISATLDGSGSSAYESEPLTYTWVCLEDGNISSTLCNPTFNLAPGIYNFSLVVNDGTWDSAAASCKVTVTENQLPIAQAGPDKTLYVDHLGKVTAMLDGRASSDPEGKPLTYRWLWKVGDANCTSTEPNFVTQLPAGTYPFSLIVNDGIDDSDSDTCTVKVIASVPARLMLTPKAINVRAHEKHVMASFAMPSLTLNDIDRTAPVMLWPSGLKADRQVVLSMREGRRVYPVIVAFFDADKIAASATQTKVLRLQVETRLKDGRYTVGSDYVIIYNPPKGRR